MTFINLLYPSYYLGQPKILLKDIVQQKKRGGQEWYQSIRLDFVHNRQCFLGVLKGLIFCFKLKKTDFSVQGQKKVESFFMWSPLQKTQWHIKTLRYFYW